MLQDTFAICHHDAVRLRDDKDALAGKLFVFATPSNDIILMSRLGSVNLTHDGPRSAERVLDLPIDQINGRHVMGMAVGVVESDGRPEASAHLIIWQGNVPVSHEGALFVFSDFHEVDERKRKPLFEQNLRMFWMRGRPQLGELPWRLMRFTNAPVELVGRNLRFRRDNLRRRGSNEPPTPWSYGEVLAVWRVSDVCIVYVLRDQAGEIVELWQNVAYCQRRRGQDSFDPVTISFPSE